MSKAKIPEELSCVQSGLLEDQLSGKKYKLPSIASIDTLAIYRSRGIKLINRVSKASQAKKCSGKQKVYNANL